MPYFFTPPSEPRRLGQSREGIGRLWFRMHYPTGVSLLKIGGFYHPIEAPEVAEIEAATVAYLGGHVYPISNDEALALIAAGYGEWLTTPGVPYPGAATYPSPALFPNGV